MAPAPGESPPDRSDAWRITRISSRTRWHPAQDVCEVCGDDFGLDSRHYYVEAAPDPREDHRRDAREEVVFCSRGCLKRWG
jgi:hypothetical protein